MRRLAGNNCTTPTQPVAFDQHRPNITVTDHVPQEQTHQASRLITLPTCLLSRTGPSAPLLQPQLQTALPSCSPSCG